LGSGSLNRSSRSRKVYGEGKAQLIDSGEDIRVPEKEGKLVSVLQGANSRWGKGGIKCQIKEGGKTQLTIEIPAGEGKKAVIVPEKKATKRKTGWSIVDFGAQGGGGGEGEEDPQEWPRPPRKKRRGKLTWLLLFFGERKGRC